MTDEHTLLPVWAEAFGRTLGWRPQVAALATRPEVPTALAAGHLALGFEGPVEPVEMLGSTGHFAHSPALVAHVRRMGFAWDTAGVVRGTPSPRAFDALAAALLPPRLGYRVAYFESERRNMPLGPWLMAYLAGRIPVQVAGEGFYRRLLTHIDAATQGELGFQFTSFAHDLSVHALNYQVVPWDLVEVMRAKILAAMPGRVATWDHPEAPGPLTLTYFFDNDLNRFCYAVWSASATLDDAVDVFRAHADQLLACLDLRIAETLAGVGDVPSADSRDMKPLSRCDFDVRPRAPNVRSDGARAYAVPGDESVFRDPPSQESVALALRREIAAVLVRAPSLPVELPAFRVRLVDVHVERRAIELLMGWEQPVAALRLAPRRGGGGEGEVLSLGKGRPAVVEVSVRTIHPSAERLASSLDTMATRLRAAITEPQWDKALELATRLRTLPVGVPMEHFRQVVWGAERQGLVRVGFSCNQDCGLCWQDRDWGRFPPEQVLTWIEDLHAAGARKLIVSGGEPTLDASLERYLRRARELGFDEITLETNAIQCAKPGVAERLRDAGVDLAFVSIHSGDAEVSDRITRAPGTQVRTVKGVHALLDAGVPVKFNAVMTGEGLDHLEGLPRFLHTEFARHGAPLRLMLSYPTEPYDGALLAEILPEPVKLRRVLRATIDACFALGVQVDGLDGPCGPPLCAHGADARVSSLDAVRERLPFRRYLAACEGCAVRTACFGVRTHDVTLYGDACAAPIAM